MVIEFMSQSGEDHISNLPDDVISHILSRLPTKDAVRTSILSKDWEYKWTFIYNIQLDDKNTSLRGKIKNKTFVSFIERVLHLTQNSRIKSFRLLCSIRLDSQYLKICIDSVLTRGVQNFEINTYQCGGNTFVDNLYNCRSLTELKLISECTLLTSLLKNCFPHLKVLYLGQWVKLLNDEISNNGQVLLDFPVLEEMELRCCMWQGVKYVEINAPALIRFLAETGIDNQDYVIKIDGAKLEKFESCGGSLNNFVVTAPSVLSAVLTNHEVLPNLNGRATLGSRARTILKGFPALEYLRLSSAIFEALTESEVNFPLPYFNRLKQLEFSNTIYCELLLTRLFQAMPSLESLSLNVYSSRYNNFYEGLESLPMCIASRLKVVKLVGFGGLAGQFRLAMSVLKHAENIEELFVSVCYRPSMPKTGIECRLLSFPKSSIRASILVDRGHWTKKSQANLTGSLGRFFQTIMG